MAKQDMVALQLSRPGGMPTESRRLDIAAKTSVQNKVAQIHTEKEKTENEDESKVLGIKYLVIFSVVCQRLLLFRRDRHKDQAPFVSPRGPAHQVRCEQPPPPIKPTPVCCPILPNTDITTDIATTTSTSQAQFPSHTHTAPGPPLPPHRTLDQDLVDAWYSFHTAISKASPAHAVHQHKKNLPPDLTRGD